MSPNDHRTVPRSPGCFIVASTIEGYNIITRNNNRADEKAKTLFSPHTKGAKSSTWDKHTGPRSGSSYGHTRNMNRGAKNKKHEHPINPNKRKK